MLNLQLPQRKLNKVRYLVAFFVISILIHGLIFLIPIPKKEIVKEEIIPIQIVDIEKEKVEEKVKEEVKSKPVPVKEKSKERKASPVPKKESAKKTTVQPTKGAKEEAPYRPEGADKPLVMPDFNVPLTETKNEKELAIPDIPVLKTENSNTNADGGDLANEIAGINAAQSNKDRLADDMLKKEVSSAKKESLASSFYTFDIEASEGKRKVVFSPKNPVFSTSNDTSVKVKFNIDKNGNTYNITFITRSSNYIESVAKDFIEKIKFQAISEDKVDYAQITITFNRK